MRNNYKRFNKRSNSPSQMDARNGSVNDSDKNAKNKIANLISNQNNQCLPIIVNSYPIRIIRESKQCFSNIAIRYGIKNNKYNNNVNLDINESNKINNILKHKRKEFNKFISNKKADSKATVDKIISKGDCYRIKRLIFPISNYFNSTSSTRQSKL